MDGDFNTAITHGRAVHTAAGPILRRIMPEVLAIGLCLTLLWGGIWLALDQTHTAALEGARQQTTMLARAFAESSERIATTVDRELLALRASMTEQGERFDLADWLRSRSSPDDLTIQISATDRDGLLTYSSIPVNGRRVELYDRPHFLAQLDPGRDDLYISAPMTGRVSQRCSVQYSRKILDAAGRFGGVAVISVSCEDLSHFYDTADLGGGFIMLAGIEGTVRGFGPYLPEVLGLDLRDAPSFADVLTRHEGTQVAQAPWDGRDRLISFRHLAHYPLLVVVGYDEERIFRSYKPFRDRALIIGGAATAMIVLLGGVWIEQRVRSAASRRSLLLTLDNMSQGIVLIDPKGRVPVINRRTISLLSLPGTLLDPVRPVRQGEAGELGLMPRVNAPDQDLLHRDGRIIESVTQSLSDGGLVRTFTDVTERRIAEARIRHMAHHDPMTGLSNRAVLIERIAGLTQNPGAKPFGLIWMDLDGFKAVNETMGHDAGDRLLREVSRRLHGLGGAHGLLARTGGDEFAVLCMDGAQPDATEIAAATIVAALREPVDLDGTQFRISASLGIAFHPEHGTTAAELLKHAVTAMSHARDRGRGLVVRFDPHMDRTLRERGQIERDLRRALRDRQLEVWFQPRFETRTSMISGFEALARWRHPERGFVPPSEFIPVAEQCGLIADLGMQVLEDACVFAASLPSGRIAVNLSPVQFLSNNLAQVIGDVLARNNLTPDRLELEITEGVLIADEKQALSTLKSLQERHLHLALDDFGTGYASLSYLRRFPFDRIKIDQSFVQAQEHDATTRAIVESVLTMARRLRLEVTAEGVETERQLNLLMSQGCPEVQGYFLGRPMPEAEARRLHAIRMAEAEMGTPSFNLSAA